MTTIAFLGTGRMGSRMAANLAQAGHELRLYNRTREKAQEVADAVGAAVLDSPADAARGADVVITMLSAADALLDTYTGDGGVLETLSESAVCIDMGTTGPVGVQSLVDVVADVGAVVVDAPVSGATAAAEAAELTLMVGGPEDTVVSVRPVLDAMASTVYHLGDTGAGSVAKLAVNNIIYALGNAVAESLVLAERAGLDRGAVYEVFENSAVAAPMVRYRHDAFLYPEDTPPMFSLSLAAKDLELITGLAAEVDAPMAQAATNLAIVRDAVEAGFSDNDMADVAVHLRGT